MKNLLFTVSGLRGIVGETLTPDVIMQYTHAFVRANGEGTYYLGRDTRPHGDMVRTAVISTLLASGCDVVDTGIVPTPTLLFVVREKNAKGGIVVTASHNPMEWNALKLVKEGGVFTFDDDVKKIKEFLSSDYVWVEWNHVGRLSNYPGAIDDHIDKILQSEYVNPDKIKRANLRVAVDTVNGANYFALPHLLERLGIREIKCLNCEPTGIFPHPPEPRKENLRELDEVLSKGEADIGFATDPDGDRLLVGFKGIGLLTEEHTIVLAVPQVLKHRKTDIVVNLSTSMMIEAIAKRFGVEVLRSKVGEANVVQKMQSIGSAFGGEGNGGVIVPEINATRDSLVGAALILSRVAEEGVDKVIQDLPPKFVLVKEKVNFRVEIPRKELIEELKPDFVDESDGLYLRKEDYWVHVRPSNTEPIMRIYAEAKNEELVKRLVDKTRKVLEKAK